MAINMELLEKFKMKQTMEQGNLKSHVGEVLTVEKWENSEYVPEDGKLHRVLAIKAAGEKDFLRTEVSAFIDKFATYVAVFGDEKPEDRPRIKITGKKSKKNNDYISFELVDENGNPL